MKKYIQIRSDCDEDRYVEIGSVDPVTHKPVMTGVSVYMPSGRKRKVFDVPYRALGVLLSKDELWDKYEEGVRP